MRDDLVEEVDGEIDLHVRENKVKVVFQGHLLGPHFHFQAHPLFHSETPFPISSIFVWRILILILILERLYMTIYIYIYIYEFESEKASEIMVVSTGRELQESEKTNETMAASAGREFK